MEPILKKNRERKAALAEINQTTTAIVIEMAKIVQNYGNSAISRKVLALAHVLNKANTKLEVIAKDETID